MQFIQGSSAWFTLSNAQHGFFTFLIVISFAIGMAFSAYLLRRFSALHFSSSISPGAEPLSLIIPAVPDNSDCAYLAQQIKTVIKNLINSQYVLKDKERFNSLFQTPLRQSIHQLRVISESLLATSPVQRKPLENRDNNSYCHAQNAISKQRDLVKSLASECNVNFESSTANMAKIAVGLSEEWLSSAIREILFNSIKHNKKRISLSLCSRVVEEYVIVTVLDDGKGLPNAITQKFGHESAVAHNLYRRKSDCENLINLTLIQEKLLGIGGNLVVNSARDYRTQVEIWIPILKRDDCAETPILENAAQIVTNTQAINSTIPKVLWVTGYANECEPTRNEIAKEFILQVASSVEEALLMVPTYKPDCVLVHEDTKVADSLAINAWIQASEKFSDIPVIILGGLIDQSSQLSALQNGLSAVVEKPVVASELKTVINCVVVEKSRLLQRVEEAIADYHINLIDHIELTASPSDTFLVQFNDMLERHYHDDNFRLAQAALAMKMPDKTLSRRIGKYYHLKYCDLIKKFRLNKAKALIVKGERITNVAYDTGFSSPSYFTQCFRAEFGFAPSMLARK